MADGARNRVWERLAAVLPTVLAALGLVGTAVSFVVETRSFRNAVRDWALSELEPRTELAASSLKNALATGDFRRVRDFGDRCARRGMRFTVFSGPRGLVFDSVRSGEAFPEAIYVTRPSGEFSVRLGLPVDRVMEPFRRARLGFALAAALGACGVLLFFLVSYRQRVRIRELARLERFRRAFIADVSHEIKTPLTGILGAVDLLTDEGLPPEQRTRLLGMVRDESQRMNGLVQGILALARLEREGDIVRPVETCPADLVDEVCGRAEPKAAARGIRLVRDIPPDLRARTVRIDPQLVTQALTNLVENALAYSGSPDVVVSLSVAGGVVGMTVEDHGRGIAPEHRGRIFERFYRVDESRDATTGGAGLGLAIVRQIARLHGGDVVLEPSKPSGCRFVLTVRG